MIVIFLFTVLMKKKSSSPLSMTYNLTKFPCISNNKSYSLGGFFRGFFPDTTKYMGVTHSRKEDLDIVARLS